MIAVAALVRHSLRRWRGFLIAMTIALIAFQFFMIFAARSFDDSGAFAQMKTIMPEFLQQWTNMAAASFRGFVLFGYSHPIVALFLTATAIAIGTEPALEIESRFVDLLLSRPIARSAVIGRSVVVLLVATVIAAMSMPAATAVGLRLIAPSRAHTVDARVVVSLAINLAFVVLAWGGIALVLASLVKRRSTATAVCGFLAFAAFIVDYVG